MATSRAQSRTVSIFGERIRDAARPVSLSAVYEQYAAPLYRYALALLGRPEEAEDVVHDVFLALMKRGGAERIRDVRAYLFTSARRRALDVQRGPAAHNRGRDDALHWWADVFACETPDRELAIDINRAIGSLSPDQREVVVLKAGEGLTFREIGRILGVSSNTAASRYRLALKRMRRLLRGDGKDE